MVVTTAGQDATTGNVLANDTDLEGDTLSVTGFTQPANGTVTDNGDGTFTYTPNANFSGSDSFTYTVTDRSGSSDTATVNVTVGAVNDGPSAVADSVTTNEDSSVTTGNVLDNDTDLDGDTLSIQSFTQASNGTVTDNGDGTFTYTPSANFNGTDSFTYTVTDGNGGTDTATVNVTVNPVDDVPATSSGDEVAVVDPGPDTGQGAAQGSDSTGGAQASGTRGEDGPIKTTDARPDGPVGESSTTEAAERAENENPADTDAGNASDAVAVQPDGARSDGARPDTVHPDAVVAEPLDTTPAGSEQPASSNNEGQNNSGAVTWDGTEDLTVLNPMEEMEDELEIAQAEFAVLEDMNDTFGAARADEARINNEFDLVGVVELPLGVPVTNMTPSVAVPAMGIDTNAPWDGDVGNRFSESAAAGTTATATVEEAEATSPRRRRAEVESGAEVALPGATDEAVDAPGTAAAAKPPLTRAAGFLVALWSAVRAGAGTTKRSDEEESGKLRRGTRR